MASTGAGRASGPANQRGVSALTPRAGKTALTLVGVIQGLTLPGATRPRGICITSWRTQDSSGLFVLVGASFGGHIIRLYHHMPQARVCPAWCSRITALEDFAGTIQGMPHR